MRNWSSAEVSTMLSATADHAVRAVLALARASAGGRRQLRADEIAVATGAPHNYLAKTLNALAKAGVVTSTRGPAGGFTLAAAPESLTLARIVDLFDAPRPHSRCLLGNAPCDPNDPCAAHACWTAVMRARREPLSTTTIADLLAGSTAPVPAGAPEVSTGATATAA
jgi:Rrf2 family transcriptional regulator, iron-sulfur cluster assembly transcription factor